MFALSSCSSNCSRSKNNLFGSKAAVNRIHLPRCRTRTHQHTCSGIYIRSGGHIRKPRDLRKNFGAPSSTPTLEGYAKSTYRSLQMYDQRAPALSPGALPVFCVSDFGRRKSTSSRSRGADQPGRRSAVRCRPWGGGSTSLPPRRTRSWQHRTTS